MSVNRYCNVRRRNVTKKETWKILKYTDCTTETQRMC